MKNVFHACRWFFHFSKPHLGRNRYSTKQWTLDNVVEHVKNDNTKRILVMAGAGISTPSGIPDFRTPGTGLYSQLEKYKLPYAEAIFDIMFFETDQRPFFDLARELYPGNYRPNISHYFVRLLQEKKKLLRMYTQNIDGLERLAGINLDLLVEAHGNFSVATCISCRQVHDGEQIRDEIMKGLIPKCTKCKRGVVKPDIVFFGEQLPQKFWSHLVDTSEADLLIVMGTSLEVEPFASVADTVDQWTPRVLINKEAVGSFVASDRPNDVVLEGDIVGSIEKLVQKLSWENELNEVTESNEKELDKKYPKKK